MADLGHGTAGTAQQLAVVDDAAADADVAEDVDEVLGVAADATQVLAQGAEAGVVVDDDRQLLAEVLAQPVAQRDVVPQQVGRALDPPSLGRTLPGTATPMTPTSDSALEALASWPAVQSRRCGRPRGARSRPPAAGGCAG